MMASRTPKGRILLLEDDPNLGFVLQEHLDANGFTVVLHTNGVDGSKAVEKQAFSLCLVDIMMPRKDGMTFVRELRQKDQKTPVIFLTAKSLKEDRVEGFKAGADDYITKPFSMEELLLRISAVLKRSAPGKGSQSGADGNAKGQVVRFGKFILDPVGQTLKHGGKTRKLTSKEAIVLEILVNQTNAVVERDAFLEKAWGDTSYHTGRSLDVFVSKLRKLFPADSGVEILNVRGTGYKLVVKKKR